MKIYLSQGGQESGPFTQAEVRAKLTSAGIAPTDLARPEGQNEWQTVESFLQHLSDLTKPRRRNLVLKIFGSVFCIIIAILLFSLMFPQYCLITAHSNQMKAASNCKQIIGLLLAYAAENSSLYPDSVTNPVTGSVPLTSNDAFRAFFQEGLTKEESIFGCPASRFNPDKNIGVEPTYEQALTAGENHWAMTQGQSNTSTSIMPLVFENPVVPSWPPKWNADAAGKPLPGRAWAGGKVIIGKNDGSVETVKLQSAQGQAVGPRLLGNGLDMFTQVSRGTPLPILNIAVSGSGSYTNDSSGLPPLPGASSGLPPPPGGGGLPPSPDKPKAK